MAKKHEICWFMTLLRAFFSGNCGMESKYFRLKVNVSQLEFLSIST